MKGDTGTTTNCPSSPHVYLRRSAALFAPSVDDLPSLQVLVGPVPSLWPVKARLKSAVIGDEPCPRRDNQRAGHSPAPIRILVLLSWVGIFFVLETPLADLRGDTYSI